MRIVKIILLATVISAAVVTLRKRFGDPTSVFYDAIAFNIPDRPPTVFSSIRAIELVCVGQDVNRCRQQAEEIFRSRNMPIRTEADYALFINTQLKETDAAVVLTLFNKNDKDVWHRRVSVTSSDPAKACRNLRKALVWSFATEWTQANWTPGKALKSVPFEVER